MYGAQSMKLCGLELIILNDTRQMSSVALRIHLLTMRSMKFYVKTLVSFAILTISSSTILPIMNSVHAIRSSTVNETEDPLDGPDGNPRYRVDV
jgi:hypothetical protein